MSPTPAAARRSARRQQRPTSPLLTLPFRQPRHPWPPLEIVSADQLEDLHLASLRILEETGIEMLDAETLALWANAGAQVDHAQQRVWIDRGLLMPTVAQAPATFRWRARNPAHDLVIGGDYLTFFPQAGMAYVSALDLPRQTGTAAHAANFFKLGQLIPVLHSCFGSVEPQDVPISARHLRGALMQYQLTDKAVTGALHGRLIPANTLAMARIVFGDPLPPDPVLGGVINCSSPLRYDSRMLGGALTYARAGQVVTVTPFIMAGAVSPISMAAAIAQQNAEALAGIATLQLAQPGAPVVYGGFTTNIDMRSGSPAFGTPEGAWALAVGAQLARRYRLPYRGSGSLCTAKTADAQAAYETMWTLWPAVMAHTHLVIHSAGWIDGGLTTSYEKFILDVEMLAMFQHFLAGFEVTPETLALASIAEVGPGGHHFGTAHTQARYLTEHYQSFVVGDRQNFETWQAAGGQNAEQRANTVWKDLLTHYEPPPLDPGINAGLLDYVARREQELAGVNLYDSL